MEKPILRNLNEMVSLQKLDNHCQRVSAGLSYFNNFYHKHLLSTNCMLSTMQDTLIHTILCNVIVSHGLSIVAGDTDEQNYILFLEFPTIEWTSILFLMQTQLEWRILRTKEANIS